MTYSLKVSESGSIIRYIGNAAEGDIAVLLESVGATATDIVLSALSANKADANVVSYALLNLLSTNAINYPNLTTPIVPIPSILLSAVVTLTALTPLTLTVQYCVTEPMLALFITGYATLSTTPLIVSDGS